MTSGSEAAIENVSAIESVVRRDRMMAFVALGVVTLLSWAYLYRMTLGMRVAGAEADMHAAMGMPEMGAWGVAEILVLFVMWSVMMVAMMLPSAAPIILLVIRTYRRRGGSAARTATAAFAGGYAIAWTGFSAVAALLQALLHETALMSSSMVSQSALLSAGFFCAAGVYQWLPPKRACLAHCRSPLHFLTEEWREGPLGGLLMGLRHGLFCVGCCWALMTLLFAAGVMNLLWVGLIAVFVLIEKVAPIGPLVGRTAGALLMVWGVYLLVEGI